MKRLLSLMLVPVLLLALATIPVTAETGAIEPDQSWFSADKTEFELKNAAELLGFLQLAQTEANFAHKTVRLTADIDLNPGTDLRLNLDEGKYVLPAKPMNVWQSLPSWKGCFDGNGHTLKGVYAQADAPSGGFGYSSLFGIISEGSVKNLVVENSLVCTKNVTTGPSGTDGSSAAGIARRLQYGATVENLWLDMDVVTVGWSGGETAGVAARIGESGGTIRSVAFVGTVAALHPDMNKANTSGGMAVSQIVANQQWKMALSLDQVVMLGTSVCSAVNGNLPVCVNSKLAEINTHAVFGKHRTLEAAKAAGQYWEGTGTTAVDFSYSPLAGGVIPTALATMMAERSVRVIGVQRSKTAYTVGEGENAYTAQSVRFVAALKLAEEQLCNFELAGFLIQIRENGADSFLVKEGTEVYVSIRAGEETKTAQEFNADYLIALSVANVPIGAEIGLTVTPYLTDEAGVRLCGTSESVTISASGEFADAD